MLSQVGTVKSFVKSALLAFVRGRNVAKEEMGLEEYSSGEDHRSNEKKDIHRPEDVLEGRCGAKLVTDLPVDRPSHVTDLCLEGKEVELSQVSENGDAQF